MACAEERAEILGLALPWREGRRDRRSSAHTNGSGDPADRACRDQTASLDVHLRKRWPNMIITLLRYVSGFDDRVHSSTLAAMGLSSRTCLPLLHASVACSACAAWAC